MDEMLALDWCIDNQARVKFFMIHNVDRVEIRVGGGYVAERDTLIEAVQAVQDLKINAADCALRVKREFTAEDAKDAEKRIRNPKPVVSKVEPSEIRRDTAHRVH